MAHIDPCLDYPGTNPASVASWTDLGPDQILFRGHRMLYPHRGGHRARYLHGHHGSRDLDVLGPGCPLVRDLGALGSPV